MRELLALLARTGLLRKLSIVAGVAGLIVLFWHFAPYLGIDLIWRSLIVAIVVLGLLGFYATKWWLSHKRGKQLVHDLTEPELDSGHEVAELRIKLKAAIKSLKSSVLGVGYHGSTALYALPWYMIIGPSAAGKTTLLRNSGLNFPLASSEDIGVTGFGGTRNCDWWFSDQAIILDTAGRYTTETNDKEEWLGFLKVLKKHRRKMPLNGVIVAIGLSDLLTGDQQNIQWHASLIRERIDELTTNLGFVVPVSIIFTKCDLLRGFSSYFDQFNAEQRSQVWGVDLEDVQRSENICSIFNQRIEDLHVQLSDLRFEYLKNHQSIAFKNELYDFPIQFQKASGCIKQFVELIIQDNPYHNKFNLSGVYFTSGCQEGLHIEYSYSTGNNKFEQNKQATEMGKVPYFIQNLLRNVIFSNRYGARLNKKMRFTLQLWKTIGMTLGAALLLIATLMWGAVYGENQRQYQATLQSAQDLLKVQQTPGAILPLLISVQLSVYQQYHQFANHQKLIPWKQRLGLYNADRLLPSLDEMLNHTLAESFMPLMTRAMTEKLQSYIQGWPKQTVAQQQQSYHDYYQTLRDYMLLALQARGDTSVDGQSMAQVWLDSLLSNKVKIDSQDLDANQLAGLVDYYLHSDKFPAAIKWQPDLQLIEKARVQLHRPRNLDEVYLNFKSNLELQTGNLKITDLYDGVGSELFNDNYKLSSIFTKAAWQNSVQRALLNAANNASRGDWVIDAPIKLNVLNGKKLKIPLGSINPELATQINRELQMRYFQDYITNWNNWLVNFQIRQFMSLSDAENGINLLTKFSSPLSDILDAVAKNFDISDLPDTATDMQDAYQLLSNSSTRHNYLSAVRQSIQDVKTIKVSDNVPLAAQKFAAQILLNTTSSSSLYKARGEITQLLSGQQKSGLYKGLDYTLTSPLRAVWQAILAQAAVEIQKQWQINVLPNYQAELAGRYPFNPSGIDADYTSVEQFFDLSQGVLWKFTHKELDGFLQLQTVQWDLRTWLDVGLPLSSDFLAKLEQAQQISMLLFSNQGKFSYAIYPIPAASLSQITLRSNGAEYIYRNGPQLWTNKVWHAESEHPFSQLLVERNDKEAQASIDGNGIWGLFRVLAQANITKQGQVYHLIWNLKFSDGHQKSVNLLFKTNSPASAIQAFVSQPFVLPKYIITREY